MAFDSAQWRDRLALDEPTAPPRPPALPRTTHARAMPPPLPPRRLAKPSASPPVVNACEPPAKTSAKQGRENGAESTAVQDLANQAKRMLRLHAKKTGERDVPRGTGRGVWISVAMTLCVLGGGAIFHVASGGDRSLFMTFAKLLAVPLAVFASLSLVNWRLVRRGFSSPVSITLTLLAALPVAAASALASAHAASIERALTTLVARDTWAALAEGINEMTALPTSATWFWVLLQTLLVAGLWLGIRCRRAQ